MSKKREIAKSDVEPAYDQALTTLVTNEQQVMRSNEERLTRLNAQLLDTIKELGRLSTVVASLQATVEHVERRLLVRSKNQLAGMFNDVNLDDADESVGPGRFRDEGDEE